MRIVETLSPLRDFRREATVEDLSLGFVPTMGALHEGHLSLIRRARAECDRVVVSIFVNPLQFGPREDLSRYPRPFERDAELCMGEGVDLLFHPSVEVMYPPSFRTEIQVRDLGQRWEGATRPGHFQGVTTVVAKLLHQVQPDRLYLGQKDAQQAVILSRMVLDLDFPLEAVICPTVREADGLALSSRNVYLSPDERSQASVLRQALQAAETAWMRGIRDTSELNEIMVRTIGLAPLAKIDYVCVVDSGELEPVSVAEPGSLAALAVWFGTTRLIDNLILGGQP